MEAAQQVRLRNDPSKIGVLTGRNEQHGSRTMLQVVFPTGTRWVPEDQVEFIDDPQKPPLDLLRDGQLAGPLDLRRTLTHVKLSGKLADVIYSMEATNTDFYAYQFKPVIKLLESPVNGLLIADEVGLGKTIESGLIWTELRSRFDMRRMVVLCPAALREKWKRELSTKIGVPARICDAAEVLEVLQGEAQESQGFALVASHQGLRPSKEWEEPDSKSAPARLARFLRANENDAPLVDLMVVDEAHHMRNSETQTHLLGTLFKSVAEYCVLLTATPIHNRNDDLSSLLRLLDPDTFGRSEVLSRVLEANGPLVKARDLVLGKHFEPSRLLEFIKEARKFSLLKNSQQLSLIEKAAQSPQLLNSREDRSRLAYNLETVNLLSHVMTRTRKRDVEGWRVIRDPSSEFVPPAAIELKYYEIVSELVVRYAMERSVNERFLLAQPQRMMTSSMAASLKSWQARQILLDESSEADDQPEVKKAKDALGPLVTEIIRQSDGMVDLDELIRVDTKYQRLKKIVLNYLEEHPKEKVIVFSAFRATLDYLAERLQSDGVSCIQLKGGQSQTKDETISQFRSEEGPSILLSSEVGGEGVDLQFSRLLVNYDLPWNPMRLEQRIGRVDRLGQKAEKVLIWNILLENTVDARIYRRLYDKLDLCRNALGDFEEILGEEIRRLEIDLLSGHLTPEQQEARIDQTEQALSNLRREQQTLEHNASNLVAYGDYILQQVGAAREMKRWVTDEDLRHYVCDHLSRDYGGLRIKEVDQNGLVVDLELPAQARFDLGEYIRANPRLSSSRLAAPLGSPVRCKFESRLTASSGGVVEQITQFHPLVRMINERVSSSRAQDTPAVAAKVAGVVVPMIEPGVYVVAMSLWSFSGLQSTEKLAYSAANLNRKGEAIDGDTAERLAVAVVSDGRDWLEAFNTIDLAKAHQVARDELFSRLMDDYEQFAQELAAKESDRASMQLSTIERHLERTMTQLRETLQTHQARGRHALVKATEGRMKALTKRTEQNRLRIQNRMKLTHDAREISVAVVLVY